MHSNFLNYEERDLFYMNIKDWKKLAGRYAIMLESPMVLMKTLFCKKVPIAVFGVNVIDKRVGLVWIKACDDIYNYKKYFVKSTMEAIYKICRMELSLDKIQMTVTEENRRWAEFIGFSFEGVLKQYRDGIDYFMYGRILWQ